MPRVRPHYAVKANPDPRVLRMLIEEGVGFEIASIAELDLLLSLGVPAAEIFYCNPMKSRAVPASTPRRKGVEWYVVDSVDELRKIVTRSSRTPSCTCASTPPTSAATGRCRASSARSRRRRARSSPPRPSCGRPRRRDLPRRLAVPQPGELARRHRERASACSRTMRRRASSRACSTSAAATRCATSSRSRRSR